MARFSYRGTTEQGRVETGTLEAPGLAEASGLLRAQGILPLSLERTDRPEAAPLEGDLNAFGFFNRSLAELTRLGFPLSRAVGEIARDLRRGRFKRALETVESRLREGKPLESAMADLPGEFPRHYLFMVRAGIASGNLPAVLGAVARNSEGFRRARRAVADALAYPAIVLTFGALLVAGFVFVYMPLYEDFYRQYRLEPTLTARGIFLLLGSPLRQGLIAAGILGVAMGLWAWMRRSVSGERFLLGIPILGRICRNLWMARMTGALGVLLKSRTPLVDAVPVALGASGSLELERRSEELRARAAEGEGLARLLEGAPVVPPEVVAYVALGERSGQAAQATQEVAELLTDRAIADSDLLYFILFPAALLLTGAALATLVIALVVPYIQFMEKLGR